MRTDKSDKNPQALLKAGEIIIEHHISPKSAPNQLVFVTSEKKHLLLRFLKK